MFKKITYYYLPWLSVLAVIFYLSSVPELVIVEESSFDLVLRKIAHMFVFFLVFVFTFRILKKENIKRPMLYSAVFAVFYAASDEYHQTFVAGRVGAVTDVIIDSFGVLIGYLFLSNYRAFRNFIG